MDFILFLVFAGIVFYFNQIKSRQQRRSEQPEDTARSAAPVSSPRSLHAPRPQIRPLLGIEITASQRRRLGKNDPSVIAANQTPQTAPAAADFFKKMKNTLEQALQELDASIQPPSNGKIKKETLTQLFEDLFKQKK